MPSSHGFTLALLISVAAAGVALVFSLLIPRHSGSADAALPVTTPTGLAESRR